MTFSSLCEEYLPSGTVRKLMPGIHGILSRMATEKNKHLNFHSYAVFEVWGCLDTVENALYVTRSLAQMTRASDPTRAVRVRGLLLTKFYLLLE